MGILRRGATFLETTSTMVLGSHVRGDRSSAAIPDVNPDRTRKSHRM